MMIIKQYFFLRGDCIDQSTPVGKSIFYYNQLYKPDFI